MKNASLARKLTESAIMLALGTILSLIKLIDLPYGGSVTVASMLPTIIIAYRWGLKWGLLTGFVTGIIQQLLGLNTLSYVTTWQSIVAVIVLDYLVAFASEGFGGVFRKKHPQNTALILGVVLACIIRYVCHVISGATVWAGLSIPTEAALIYSLGYNATYMIPETIVTAIAAFYIGSMLDFRRDRITRVPDKKGNANALIRWAGGVVAGLVIIVDTVLVFAKLQNSESGEFDIKGLSSVNWVLILIITAAGLLVSLSIYLFSKRSAAKS